MITSVLLKELQLCWGFARRDLGIGTLPVPLFTMASLLYKNTPAKEMIHPIASAFIYGIFYLYSFVVANQIAGVEEDKINKPDRPITSGATSLEAATIRYYVLSALYLAYSYFLGVEKYTLLWIATTYAHNFLGFATFGPTKDMCMGFGAIAQLMAAWTIGGAASQMGWKWTKTITIIMSWAIPIQDLRDVPGDLIAMEGTISKEMGDHNQTHESDHCRRKPSHGIVPLLKNTILDQQVLRHKNARCDVQARCHILSNTGRTQMTQKTYTACRLES